MQLEVHLQVLCPTCHLPMIRDCNLKYYYCPGHPDVKYEVAPFVIEATESQRLRTPEKVQWGKL